MTPAADPRSADPTTFPQAQVLGTHVTSDALMAWADAPTRTRPKCWWIIPAQGHITQGAGTLTLANAQAVVGGWIEYAPHVIPGVDIVVNEEGLIRQLPINQVASFLAERRLVGTAIISNYRCIK